MSFEDKSEKEKLDMFVHAFKRAGCRAIIQGFAKQLSDINVATKPLPSKDLSEQSIYEAIIEMKSSYDEKRKNAEAISEKIKSEGGVKEAVRLIENVMQG